MPPTPPAQTGAGSPGAAVVLPLPPGVAVSLALAEGVAPSELHLTLAYLPAVDRADAVVFEQLRAVVAAWAAPLAPIAASLSGVGRFTGEGTDGDAFVLLADAPGLGAQREALVTALVAAGFEVSAAHGFSPHVTLRYLAADDEMPLDRVGPVALTFEGVEVWRGDTHDLIANFTPAAADTTTMHRNLTPFCYGAPVALSLTPTDAPGGPWTEIAYEVDLKGYKLASGGNAKIAASNIDEMVRNFARYPKVPIVIEHADTREGSPVEWAEPQGWIVGLRKGSRERTVAGKTVTVATLEAQLSVSDEVRLQILGDVANGVPPTWPFCSITPAQGRDDETGAELGSVLWSVSLTAHPRLADLPRLAASRSHHPMKNRPRRGATTTAPAAPSIEPADPNAPQELGYWYGEIKTRGDVLSMLRTVLDLPVVTTEEEVLAKIATLESLSTQPEEASGVDVDDLVGMIRRALGLDALKTTAEVVASVREALDTLPASEAMPAATTMSRATARAANPAPTPEKTMKKTFLELAAEMRVPAATEDAAQDAVLTLSRDGAAVRAALKLDLGAPLAPALAAVAEDRAELSKARTSLAAVTAERDAAAAKVKAIEEAAAKAEADRALADLTAHVDAVALSKAWDEDTKALVLAGAKADPAGFAAKHPKPSAQELGQRMQDPARLEALNLGKPPAKAPNAGEGSPSTPGAALKAQIGSLREINPDLSVLEATALASRGVTPESYARELGVQS